ncbi:MAG: sigma 54-interacting transcriptional regulator [Xanthomonadales bacterium]|nr:sigma 54-interacting transcriptional regulator [Xanthomonadales bacterium]
MRVRYSLEWLDGSQPRRDLPPGRYRIGRGNTVEIALQAAGVSREHAELEICLDRGLRIRDLDSTNGTMANGERIADGAFCGDVDLAIGSARLRLRERLGGLDEVWGGGPVQGDPRPAEPATPPDPTASADLLHELRGRVSRWRPSSGWDAASVTALLGAWAELLEMPDMCIRSDDGVVWAAAGLPTRATEQLAEAGGRFLYSGPLTSSAARALASIGTDLLLFLPGLQTAPDPNGDIPAPESWPGLPSASPAVRRVLSELERAARGQIPILLHGETGVGKERVARWLHRCSSRAHGPFLALNCAALPQELIEAELFGVEKGAATGVAERPGLIEQADGGTLFLDEIGDMAAATQVRLLRVLEDGQCVRVGGRQARQVDVRWLAATHRHLEAEVGAERFRLDLYHRLAGFSATLPSLRERQEDLIPLALEIFGQALQTAGRRSPGLTTAAVLALLRHPWPGNVRELRQAIERAVSVLDDAEALDIGHLPESLRGPLEQPASLRLDAAVERAERAALCTALALTGGQHDAAWPLLGIGKTSFYKKLKAYGLGRVEGLAEDEE